MHIRMAESAHVRQVTCCLVSILEPSGLSGHQEGDGRPVRTDEASAGTGQDRPARLSTRWVPAGPARSGRIRRHGLRAGLMAARRPGPGLVAGYIPDYIFLTMRG